MSFYVYILRCSDGYFYTGPTDNMEARISSHYTGHIAGYTSRRRPVTLEFTEEFPTRIEALERERQIKGWSRKKKQALIQGNWGTLSKLSRAHGSTSSPRTVAE
jgi:predicted GIY-YIG superfamily endonuclease